MAERPRARVGERNLEHNLKIRERLGVVKYPSEKKALVLQMVKFHNFYRELKEYANTLTPEKKSYVLSQIERFKNEDLHREILSSERLYEIFRDRKQVLTEKSNIIDSNNDDIDGIGDSSKPESNRPKLLDRNTHELQNYVTRYKNTFNDTNINSERAERIIDRLRELKDSKQREHLFRQIMIFENSYREMQAYADSVSDSNARSSLLKWIENLRSKDLNRELLSERSIYDMVALRKNKLYKELATAKHNSERSLSQSSSDKSSASTIPPRSSSKTSDSKPVIDSTPTDARLAEKAPPRENRGPTEMGALPKDDASSKPSPRASAPKPEVEPPVASPQMERRSKLGNNGGYDYIEHNLSDEGVLERFEKINVLLANQNLNQGEVINLINTRQILMLNYPELLNFAKTLGNLLKNNERLKGIYNEHGARRIDGFKGLSLNELNKLYSHYFNVSNSSKSSAQTPVATDSRVSQVSAQPTPPEAENLNLRKLIKFESKDNDMLYYKKELSDKLGPEFKSHIDWLFSESNAGLESLKQTLVDSSKLTIDEFFRLLVPRVNETFPQYARRSSGIIHDLPYDKVIEFAKSNASIEAINNEIDNNAFETYNSVAQREANPNSGVAKPSITQTPAQPNPVLKPAPQSPSVSQSVQAPRVLESRTQQVEPKSPLPAPQASEVSEPKVEPKVVAINSPNIDELNNRLVEGLSDSDYEKSLLKREAGESSSDYYKRFNYLHTLFSITNLNYLDYIFTHGESINREEFYKKLLPKPLEPMEDYYNRVNDIVMTLYSETINGNSSASKPNPKIPTPSVPEAKGLDDVPTGAQSTAQAEKTQQVATAPITRTQETAQPSRQKQSPPKSPLAERPADRTNERITEEEIQRLMKDANKFDSFKKSGEIAKLAVRVAEHDQKRAEEMIDNQLGLTRWALYFGFNASLVDKVSLIAAMAKINFKKADKIITRYEQILSPKEYNEFFMSIMLKAAEIDNDLGVRFIKEYNIYLNDIEIIFKKNRSLIEGYISNIIDNSLNKDAYINLLHIWAKQWSFEDNDNNRQEIMTLAGELFLKKVNPDLRIGQTALDNIIVLAEYIARYNTTLGSNLFSKVIEVNAKHKLGMDYSIADHISESNPSKAIGLYQDIFKSNIDKNKYDDALRLAHEVERLSKEKALEMYHEILKTPHEPNYEVSVIASIVRIKPELIDTFKDQILKCVKSLKNWTFSHMSKFATSIEIIVNVMLEKYPEDSLDILKACLLIESNSDLIDDDKNLTLAKLLSPMAKLDINLAKTYADGNMYLLSFIANSISEKNPNKS